MKFDRMLYKCAGVLVTAAAVMVVTADAMGQETTVSAVHDPNSQSSFTLNFADLGFQTSSTVINTDFQLVIDETAGTARFVQYDQTVEPLILPGPTPEGISTGDMSIRIVPGSSSGTYNPLTETFTTNEEYEISFTGDLAAFGLISPVVLPSTTVGQFKGGTAAAREIQMNWSGVGQLANPASPSNPLNFNYVCQVNTVTTQPDAISALLALLQSLCGVGFATMMPFAVLGLWLMKSGLFLRRRGARK